jgi:hypothetical protein
MEQKKIKNYLEIGVFNGRIFFRIKSNFKIAVDPEFFFSNSRKLGKTFLNPYNLYNQYFQKSSDEFFAADAPAIFSSKKIELALIDGMHEYAFALRDVENVLKYSDDDAILILHDCNPQSRNAACSYKEWKDRQYTGTWNGDVWKTILDLRSRRKDLTAFVLDCDHGLGVVVKKKNEFPLPYTQEEINRLTYEDFDANREKWLDLKPPSYFYDFFDLK